MSRRIIWILLGGLLLLGAVALLWWWFLMREPLAPDPSGSFGSSGDRPVPVTPLPSGGTNQGTSIPSPGGTLIGGTADAFPIGAGGGGGLSGDTGSSPAPGVSWLGGGNIFNPTPINAVDSGSVSGSLSSFGGIGSSAGAGGGEGGSGFEGALIGAGVGLGLCTAGFVTSGALAGAGITAANQLTAVRVSDAVTNMGAADTALRENFLNCMTRVLAKVALDQMTASIINWINSGFEGKPSFVTNYKQFFTNVADAAAGEFIRGSELSFLCSPFQPQVRIAIAQSYARRNTAPSCTLSQVTNNIEGFMRGNFSDGGWRSMIAFTTMPTNNPYGAYMYGQAGLYNAQNQAVTLAGQELQIGRGFLSFKDAKGNIQTPGSVIESSLSNTLNVPQEMLTQAGISGNFDAIVSALIQQLLTRTLYGGLSNLSVSASGYENNFLSATDVQAQQEAQTLLTTLQGSVSIAQQYGHAKQGSITDIQNAQQQLQNLANCWLGRGDQTKESEVLGEMDALETRVTRYNNDITRANAAIATLQQLQTRVFSATTPAQVHAIQADFASAQASGSLISQANVTQAQQDRSGLQAEMASINQQTAARLDQCYAGGA